MMMAAENSVEDYWEDASVSWGCTGLSLSCPFHPQQAPRDGPVFPHKQDPHSTSALRLRNLPPPITLCTTFSFKAGGRFVLKELALPRSHSFRAERKEGRLCLHLIELEEPDEEEEEEDCCSTYDNDCNAEDASVCAYRHHQPDGYETLATESIDENMRSHEQEEESIQGTPAQMLKETVLEEIGDAASASLKNAVEHIDSGDIGCGADCIPSTVRANEIVSKNEGGAYMGVLSIGQHSFLGNKGGLNPCSSKQVLFFPRACPPLGLAVS